MKKFIKIMLLIVGILVIVIILDTLQARLFKNSPIIHWKQVLDGNSYVDRGILVDTYYCGSKTDISWHYKTDKFTCPVNAISKELYTKLKGTWVADGTEAKYIVSMEDGKPIYADDYNESYKLTFDSLGNYKIVTAQNKYVGKYEFNGKNLTLLDEEELIKDRCELKTPNELTCERLAAKFVK